MAVGESHGTLSMSIERRAREARRGDSVEGSNAWRGDGVEQPHTRAGEGDRDIRGTGECHTQRRSKTKGNNNAGRHGRPGLPRARARREGERPPRPPGGVVRRRRELSGRAAARAAHDAAAAARAPRGRRRHRGRARREALAAALRARRRVAGKVSRKAATSHDDAVALRSNAPPPPPRSLVSAALDAFPPIHLRRVQKQARAARRRLRPDLAQVLRHPQPHTFT